jgi:hypothetical protein
MQSSTSESVSSSTQNKSTSSVQGTENNNVKVNVTNDTRAKLLDIAGQIDSNTTNSKFLKISGNQTKVLLFDPEQVEYITITYPNKEGEEPNKPVNRVRFILKEANGDGSVPADRESADWVTSQTTAKLIINYLVKGFTKLEVSRSGQSMYDTKYSIVPFL